MLTLPYLIRKVSQNDCFSVFIMSAGAVVQWVNKKEG